MQIYQAHVVGSLVSVGMDTLIKVGAREKCGEPIWWKGKPSQIFHSSYGSMIYLFFRMECALCV